MARGFSAAYDENGLDRGCYAAASLPQGAELIRAENPPLPFLRARHQQAVVLHLCRAVTPGRITRHVGGIRNLPPPRVGLLELTPGDTDLEFEAEARTSMLTLSLPQAVFAALDADPDRAFTRGLLPFRDDALRAVLVELAERADGGDSERLFLDHALCFLAAALATPRRRVPVRALDGVRLSRVLGAMEAAASGNTARPPALPDLADLAGLSLAEFARGFRAATGESPHAYLTRRRIEHAQALLLERPALPLAEVAAALGFADQAHFSRRFRQVTGTTPGRFRRGR
ncbi:helix-turn-helix transcriptional regulator [Roseomonas hellenica]|uniref:Helix-turn-helix transcriptional regulator n=1 Tax=Plastoroseomonas hellenica TaxID=2687306 RepID=A0ABS5ERV2_9PROT|nr:helix-turn-helix transcriptional regulator [Plastoroseomonas hellenica]MBR0663027.1 helix-turn-helix transcriptional regulator [Plastoroseomonas hellenica]